MLPSSVTLSPPKPLGGILLYRTCYITSPHGKGVREQHYFSMRPSVHASVHSSVTLSPPEPLGGILPTSLHHFPSRYIIFPCVRPSMRPSHYLLLNHWAEFYRTCYIISPHGKGVRDNIFSVRPSVHSSVTLSPPKTLGEILPNLLHHFPSW